MTRRYLVVRSCVRAVFWSLVFLVVTFAVQAWAVACWSLGDRL